MNTTNPNQPEKAPERIWIRLRYLNVGAGGGGFYHLEVPDNSNDATPYVPAARLDEVVEALGNLLDCLPVFPGGDGPTNEVQLNSCPILTVGHIRRARAALEAARRSNAK